jgi:hypothetical protein
MNLRERFAEADRIEFPELWSEVRRRSEVTWMSRSKPPSGPSPGRRVTAILIAFAVFAAAAIFAWTRFSEGLDSTKPATPQPTPSGVDLSGIPEGWTELAPPPAIRTGASQVWTGSQLLVWGGRLGGNDERAPERDGMVFDVATNTWDTIPPAPIDGRGYAAKAWTGSELVVWGGWDGSFKGDEPGTFADGAAYDPSTQQWRVLPPNGLTSRAPLSVWTGDELIVWGTSFRTKVRPLDGAAYTPASDSWRPIADGPIELTDAVAEWTGTEMIVFGAALHGGNFPETPTAIGAAYDPATDSWRALPDSDIDTNANSASWLGDRLIAWDYSEHTSAYSLATDSWSSLAGPPVDACEDVPRSVTAEGYVFGELCGEQVVMLPDEDRWHNVSRRDLAFWPATFAPAEDIVFVMGYESFEQDAPARMFAFRPPSSFACGGFPGLSGEELAAAVAARFELLRSDRREALSRPEIEDLLSPQGEAAFEDPANSLAGLFGNVALDEVMMVEPLASGNEFSVVVRMYDLGGTEKFSEELTLRPGTNLSGDECELVVDDVNVVA